MKVVSAVLILVVFVAASGSRAQAIPATSAAFRLCQGGCQSINALAREHGHDTGDLESAGMATTAPDVSVSNRECFLCGTETLD